MKPEERLKQEILKKYKSVRAFTKEIDVSYSTVDSMLKRGLSGAGVSTVLKVCKALGIDLESLIDDQNISSSFSFTQNELYHIRKYRALDEHGKKMVDFTLTEEYNRLYPPIKSTRAEQRTIEIDFVDNALASAGIGELMGDVNREKISVPETPTTRRADFAIRVRGDSMEPAYYDDDIVLVHKTDYVPDGEIGIFVVDGETYIKKAGKNRLISINPEYDDIIGTEETEIYTMGLVIGKL